MSLLRAKGSKPPGQRFVLGGKPRKGTPKRQTLLAEGESLKREAQVAEGKETLRGKRKQNVVRDNKEEMTMKKQIFGAILLSAALAVGTAMPAFAAAGVGSDENYTLDTTNNTAQTEVHVETTISQINVTIPLQFTVVADSNGGDLTTPTNYQLKNNGTFDVYVTKVYTDTSVGQADWGLVAMDNAGVGVGVRGPAAKTFGNIALQFEADSSAALDLSNSTNRTTGFKTDNTDGSWMIGKSTVSGSNTRAGVLNIAITGKSSQINSHSDTASHAVDVVYTIAALPNATE